MTYVGNRTGNRIMRIPFPHLTYCGLSIRYGKNVTGTTTAVTKHFYANGMQVAKIVGSTVY